MDIGCNVGCIFRIDIDDLNILGTVWQWFSACNNVRWIFTFDSLYISMITAMQNGSLDFEWNLETPNDEANVVATISS
jgi:hypothetical protein